MYRKTSVVVAGVVTDIGPPVVGKGGTVYRLCHFTVEELLKAPPSVPVGATVTVFQPGGTARVGSVEYRTTFITDPLVKGDRMVLFLEKGMEEGQDVFLVRIAAGDAFRSSNGQSIAIRADLARLNELKGRSTVGLGELVSFLRSLR